MSLHLTSANLCKEKDNGLKYQRQSLFFSKTQQGQRLFFVKFRTHTCVRLMFITS